MSNENPSEADPKIIVDDDWKQQVEQEKERLKKSASSAESPNEESPNENSPHDDAAPAADGEPVELPPASFMVLLSTLATQAMSCLGIFPDPATGQLNVNRPMAKHFIDTLAMLQEKTKGNLNDDEAAHLRDGLHQLRMAYVSTEKTANTPANTPAKAEPKKSSIELP